jgi:phosphatidylinositol glycan class B
VILLTFVVLLVKRPKHLLVWCILPYVIVHSLIAHKELRFLYPLACLVPWMLMEAWRSVPSTWIPIRATLHWMTAGLLIVTNTVGLLVVMSSPAGEGRVRLAEALHEHAQPGDRIAYVVEPDIAWRITLPAFYAPVGTEEVVIDPMTPAMDTANMDFIVLQDDAPVPVMTEGTILTELARTETKWVKALLFWYTWGEGRQPWTVYRVEH